MPTPPFVLELRAKIGTDPLWLSGVTAVIRDEAGENLLLIKRSDTAEWAPVTGIIDPGEEPAVAAAREAMEEAGVRIRVDRLASIAVTGPVVYDNGDRAQYLDLTFECRYLDGEPRPVDGEALEVAWFPVDELPPMDVPFRQRIDTALTPGPAQFRTA